MKKVFIIIGVLLIVGLIIWAYLNAKKKAQNQQTKPNEPIKTGEDGRPNGVKLPKLGLVKGVQLDFNGKQIVAESPNGLGGKVDIFNLSGTKIGEALHGELLGEFATQLNDFIGFTGVNVSRKFGVNPAFVKSEFIKVV